MDVVDIITGYMQAGVGVLPLHTMRGERCTCGRPAGNGPADCHSPAKHPLTPHGKDDATTDAGLVAEWLARWPGCNWGVRPPEGVVVLDVDPRNGGDASLAKLELQHGPLPRTLTARTGSGGLHIWFSYNGPKRGKLAEGIDVKSNSGYLVAPPSVHACGGVYEWLDQRPAAYAPAWVKAILNPPVRRFAPGRTGGSIEPLVRVVAAAAEGERNRRLYWAACRAHEKGLDPTPLIDAALAVGLDHASSVATVKSAENAAPRVVEQRAPASAEFMGRRSESRTA